MKVDWLVYRIYQDEKGTVSNSLVRNEEDLFEPCGFILELPYKSNCRNISCIPSGLYRFEKRNHQSRGQIFMLSGVLDRTSILVHVGNYLKDTQGCLLPCSKFKINKDGLEYVGLSSKAAIEQLWACLPYSGILHIVGTN